MTVITRAVYANQKEFYDPFVEFQIISEKLVKPTKFLILPGLHTPLARSLEGLAFKDIEEHTLEL
jgi:hypothetical protein